VTREHEDSWNVTLRDDHKRATLTAPNQRPSRVRCQNFTKAVATNVGAPGLDWRLLGADDHNGDGKADLLWQTDAGKLAVWQMDGTHVAAADYECRHP
jgi:hypothetical protein